MWGSEGPGAMRSGFYFAGVYIPEHSRYVSPMNENDLAQTAWETAEYEGWAREHADYLEQQAFEEWAARREDDEDSSREAWVEWLENQA